MATNILLTRYSTGNEYFCSSVWLAVLNNYCTTTKQNTMLNLTLSTNNFTVFENSTTSKGIYNNLSCLSVQNYVITYIYELVYIPSINHKRATQKPWINLFSFFQNVMRRASTIFYFKHSSSLTTVTTVSQSDSLLSRSSHCSKSVIFKVREGPCIWVHALFCLEVNYWTTSEVLSALLRS